MAPSHRSDRNGNPGNINGFFPEQPFGGEMGKSFEGPRAAPGLRGWAGGPQDPPDPAVPGSAPLLPRARGGAALVPGSCGTEGSRGSIPPRRGSGGVQSDPGAGVTW